MLVYPVLNETKCCAARLCTECYLQIRPPRHSKEPCPFCKHRKFDAVFVGPKASDVLDEEERDQIRAADAMRRATQTTAPVVATLRHSASIDGAQQQQMQQSARGAEAAMEAGASFQQGRAADRDKEERVSMMSAARMPYFHEPCSPIDPLLLEAMASEVTYVSPSASAVDRASAASSSGVLEGHARELRADGESESEAESVSYLAESRHRVVRLPWYGVDVDRAGMEGEVGEEEMGRQERISLNEAIRRSLIEM